MKNIIKIASVVILLAMVNNIFGQQNNFAFWADNNFPATNVQAWFTYHYDDGTVGDEVYRYAEVNTYGDSYVAYTAVPRQENKPGYLEIVIEDNYRPYWIRGGNPLTISFEDDTYIFKNIHWDHGFPREEDALYSE